MTEHGIVVARRLGAIGASGVVAAMTLALLQRAECPPIVSNGDLYHLTREPIRSQSPIWILGTRRMIAASYVESGGEAGYFFAGPMLDNIDLANTHGAWTIIKDNAFYGDLMFDNAASKGSDVYLRDLCLSQEVGVSTLFDMRSAFEIAMLDDKIELDRLFVRDCIFAKFQVMDHYGPLLIWSIDMLRRVGGLDDPRTAVVLTYANHYIDIAHTDSEVLSAMSFIDVLDKAGISANHDGVLNRVEGLIERKYRLVPVQAKSLLRLADKGWIACAVECRTSIAANMSEYIAAYSTTGICREGGLCSFLETALALEVLESLDEEANHPPIRAAVLRHFNGDGWGRGPFTNSGIDPSDTFAAVLIGSLLEGARDYDPAKVQRYFSRVIRNSQSIDCSTLHESLLGLSLLSDSQHEFSSANVPADIRQVAEEVLKNVPLVAGLDSAACLQVARFLQVKEVGDRFVSLQETLARSDVLLPWRLRDLALGHQILSLSVPKRETNLLSFFRNGAYVPFDDTNLPWLSATTDAVIYDSIAFGSHIHHEQTIRATTSDFQFPDGGFGQYPRSVPGVSVFPTLRATLDGLLLIGLLDRAASCRKLRSYLPWSIN